MKGGTFLALVIVFVGLTLLLVGARKRAKLFIAALKR
jgi:hypothetical protein